jgi:molybdate transport system substrate-binding protein
MKVKACIAGAIFALIATSASSAGAAEIRVLAPRAVATMLGALAGDFERASGHKLDVSVDLAAVLVRRVNAGEAFDVVIVAPAQIDALAKDGKVLGDTRANLVRSGIGVEVRAGAPKPDVSTVDAFKRALIAAKSIAYLKEGQSGLYVAQMIERLGLTEALKPKLTLPATDTVTELVAGGEVELGMVNASQILTSPGVVLAGELPPELNFYLVFAGAVGTAAKSPDAARDFYDRAEGFPCASVSDHESYFCVSAASARLHAARLQDRQGGRPLDVFDQLAALDP